MGAGSSESHAYLQRLRHHLHAQPCLPTPGHLRRVHLYNNGEYVTPIPPLLPHPTHPQQQFQQCELSVCHRLFLGASLCEQSLELLPTRLGSLHIPTHRLQQAEESHPHFWRQQQGLAGQFSPKFCYVNPAQPQT